MSTTTTRAVTRTTSPLGPAGAWCVGAGLVGVAQAVILLLWAPQVSADRYSYPFTGLGYGVAQVSFFLQHLPLIAGVAALLRLPAVRASRAGWVATWVAMVGLALLTVLELVAIIAYQAATDSALANLVSNLYGPPVIMVGAGLLVAGIATTRQGTATWAGAPWLPPVVVLLGVYVFVPLTPAIMGSFVAGRLGIGGWMLLFAVFGYGLTRLVPRGA